MAYDVTAKCLAVLAPVDADTHYTDTVTAAEAVVPVNSILTSQRAGLRAVEKLQLYRTVHILH